MLLRALLVLVALSPYWLVHVSYHFLDLRLPFNPIHGVFVVVEFLPQLLRLIRIFVLFRSARLLSIFSVELSNQYIM